MVPHKLPHLFIGGEMEARQFDLPAASFQSADNQSADDRIQNDAKIISIQTLGAIDEQRSE